MTVRLASLRWDSSAAACAFSDAFSPLSISFTRSGWFKANRLADALKYSLTNISVLGKSFGWQIAFRLALENKTTTSKEIATRTVLHSPDSAKQYASTWIQCGQYAKDNFGIK